MRTRKAIIDFNRYGQAELGPLALSIAGKLRDNAHFPNPMPSLDSVEETARAYLSALEQAHHGTPEQTAEKNVWREKLLKVLHDLGNYVNTIADGDLVALDSSGFPLSKPPAPVGILDAPRDLQLADGGAGAIAVSFQPVAHARGYLIQYAVNALPADDTGWTDSLETKSKSVLRGLTSGAQYWVRVAAISSEAAAQNTYHFSAPVSRYAQ